MLPLVLWEVNTQDSVIPQEGYSPHHVWGRCVVGGVPKEGFLEEVMAQLNVKGLEQKVKQKMSLRAF